MSPIRWVFVSLIASLIAVVLIIKNPRPLFIVFIISLLPLIAIFKPGTYQSGDMSIHVTKLMVFYKSLSEGNIVPKWADILNAGYGYPLFLNTYILPYYLGSIFRLVGFSYLLSIKLTIAVSFIASGIFMYLWLRDWLKSDRAGVVGALFYLYTPYHLVTMHFRVAIGEIVAFAIIPLVFWGIWRNKLLLTIISTWLLILSHQVIALSIFPVFLIYCWLVNKKQIMGLILGVITASHYWIPMLLESKYIYQSLTPVIMQFPKITEFLFVPWRWGLLFQGHFGELGFLVGYTQIIILIISFWFKNKLIIIFSSLYLGYFLFMQSFAKPIWDILPLVGHFQFSYRLLVVLCVLISIIAALVSEKINKYLLIILCFITVGYTILNWSPRQHLSDVGDKELMANAPYITYETEGGIASPIWMPIANGNPWKNKIPAQAMTVLKHESEIHLYRTKFNKNIVVSENTAFYPGWELYIDSRKQEIQYPNGVIQFSVPEGEHIIRLLFTNTPIREISKSITILTLVIIGGCKLYGILDYSKPRKIS